MPDRTDAWPELRYEEYGETKDTLHIYAQILGKLRLTLKPPLAQWAHAPLQLAVDGFTTGPLWVDDGALAATLDLIHHEASLERSDGRRETVKAGGAVAEFYRQVRAALDRLDVTATINLMPQEVQERIPFDEDTTHATYYPEQAQRLWQAQLRVGAVLERFQSGFWGKQSPVGLYWGGFDFGMSRYSGRPIPAPEGLGQIAAGALDAELMGISFGLGNAQMPQPFFLISAFPPPAGMDSAQLHPHEARYAEFPGMGDVYMLSYEDVRKASDPAQALLDFCTSAYVAIASLGGWDRELLERRPPAIKKAA
jgi:Family of unknown function (DUF5996)